MGVSVNNVGLKMMDVLAYILAGMGVGTWIMLVISSRSKVSFERRQRLKANEARLKEIEHWLAYLKDATKLHGKELQDIRDRVARDRNDSFQEKIAMGQRLEGLELRVEHMEIVTAKPKRAPKK